MKRTWLALAAGLAMVLASGAAAAASVSAPAQAVALAGDGPPGFWWGTDSFNGLRAGQARRTACRSSAAPTAATSG